MEQGAAHIQIVFMVAEQQVSAGQIRHQAEERHRLHLAAEAPAVEAIRERDKEILRLRNELAIAQAYAALVMAGK